MCDISIHLVEIGYPGLSNIELAILSNPLFSHIQFFESFAGNYRNQFTITQKKFFTLCQNQINMQMNEQRSSIFFECAIRSATLFR